mgnify:CR=1 FL=1
MAENKKIKNARKIFYNGIHFKSNLEVTFYKTLVSAGLVPKYEEYKFILFEGFRPTVPFYNRSKSKVFRLDMSKVRDITYTPDFTIYYKDTLFIIEAKGKENDTYPIKKKLFRKVLESVKIPCVYFEVHTKKELLEVIDIIKSYGTATEKNQEISQKST